jgi:hypothetical protein
MYEAIIARASEAVMPARSVLPQPAMTSETSTRARFTLASLAESI